MTKEIKDQGWRKVQKSGGASTIRPRLSQTLCESPTLFNLENSGGRASGSPAPPSSAGPEDAILPDCGESSSSEESFLWSLPFPPFLSLQKMDKKKYQSQHEYHTLH